VSKEAFKEEIKGYKYALCKGNNHKLVERVLLSR
jgi:hypothetical protein